MALPEETKPPLQERTKLQEIKGLLDSLAASTPAERQSAAKTIYGQGCELATRVVREWLSDAEVAGSFVSSETSFPDMTVGVAVEPPRFEAIRQANDSPRLADVPPDIDAKEFEIHFSNRAHIDVLTTRDRDGEGAIARFLKRNGEGIQQVELAVKDVRQATSLLQNRMGLNPIYSQARPGADGTLVNFFLIDFTTPAGGKKKLLIELVQTGSAGA